MAKFTKIYYRNEEITTIKQLFDVEKIKDVSIKDFLDIKDPFSEVKNRDAIFAALTEQQLKNLNIATSSDVKEDTPIKPPAVFWIQKDKVTLDLITANSKFVKQEDFNAFLSEAQKDLIESRDYIKSEVVKSYPECTVWIWSKSIETNPANNQVSGSIINITDFIQDLRINLAETGGNFQISLPFIPAIENLINIDGIYNKNEGWNINKQNESKIIQQDGTVERIYNETFHTTKSKSQNQNDLNSVRNIDLGSVAFSVNDIVFIKFERLEIEHNQYVSDFFVDRSALNNEVFDMIGLIDTVSTNSSLNDISISISGRDCMKLILDDGTFFFEQSYTDPDAENGVFMNIDEVHGDKTATSNNLMSGKYRALGRNIITGLITEFNLPSARTIENALDYIIKILANIEICPDSVFEAYGPKRTRFRKETTKPKK